MCGAYCIRNEIKGGRFTELPCGLVQERDDDLAYPLGLRLSTAPTGRNPWEVDDS